MIERTVRIYLACGLTFAFNWLEMSLFSVVSALLI
jgi:hypothetical protein